MMRPQRPPRKRIRRKPLQGLRLGAYMLLPHGALSARWGCSEAVVTSPFFTTTCVLRSLWRRERKKAADFSSSLEQRRR